MRDRLTQPGCSSCEHCYFHEEKTARIMKGVRLQPYERYCLGLKRPRIFRRKDPKFKTPTWCPKRKNPREFRVYGFKSTDEWLLHEKLCDSFGKEILPSAWRYTLRHESKLDLSASDFWKRCENEAESELLPVPVALHEVVEIDDGLKPVFFYKTRQGYRIAHGYTPVATEK